MKKHLFFLCLALIGVTQLFAYDCYVDGIYYNLNSTNLTAEVTSETGDYSAKRYFESVIIPASITYNSQTYSVTSIGEKAFYLCENLASVTISNSVTTIGEEAFEFCKGLTSIIIPNSVTTIGDYAFSDCSGLISITIPNSVTGIGDGAFARVNNLVYNGSVPPGKWGAKCVNGYVDGYLVYDDESKTTLCGCSSAAIGELSIPNSVILIGDEAFYGCSGLTSVEIPNSVRWIGTWIFAKCSGLTSIELPASITEIGHYMFCGCSRLETVTITNSIIRIKDGAFCDCSNLTTITIPRYVNSIGDYAFSGCKGLNSITSFAITPPTCDSRTFDGIDRAIPVYVHPDFIVAYQQAKYWNEFNNIQENKDDYADVIGIAEHGIVLGTGKHIKGDTCSLSVSPFPGYYFVQWSDGNNDNPRTIDVTQDTTLTAIFGYRLSNQCGKDNMLTWTLDTVTLALNIMGKGDLTENYTYGNFIESLTINNEITSVGKNAFKNFNNLKNVILGSVIKVLEDSAFFGCSAIESIICYGQRPPTVKNLALSALSYETIIYVPKNYINTYQMHDVWGLYDVRPIEAGNVETIDVVITTPSNNSVTITWPITDGTDTYTLTITKNGEIVCTLTFNAQGQLLNIAFAAPSHNGAHQAPAATLTAQGYQFTVTGLNPGTAYNYSVTATDAGGQTLAEHKGNFSTTGGTGLNTLPYKGKDGIGSKYFHNGNLIIERNGIKYTTTGQKVR